MDFLTAVSRGRATGSNSVGALLSDGFTKKKKKIFRSGADELNKSEGNNGNFMCPVCVE